MSLSLLLLQQADQIAYCRGANNYSWIHFRTGQKKIVAKPLSSLQPQLPDFVRVHKTVLINPRYIKGVQQLVGKKGAGILQMESGESFPISRRRWSGLAPLLTPAVTVTNPPVVESNPQTVRLDSPQGSIFLVTTDSIKVQQTNQLIDQHWAAYRLQTLHPSALMATLLPLSSTPASPTLILLDAQTATLERMNMLRLLKTTSQLKHIPVILFVCLGDHFVIEGYDYQANSVVTLPSNGLLAEQHLQRILHFWLRVVALPNLND